MLFHPVAALAEHAHRVRFVHHQLRAVFLAKLGGTGQINDVTIHAEDRIHNHQFRTPVGVAAQERLQMLHVVVAKALHLRAGKQAAIHNAGVVVFVAEDHIVAADHRGDGSQIGDVAAGKGDCVFGVLEFCDSALQLQMQIQRARQQPHAVGAAAIFLQRPSSGGVDARVTQQSQVSIGGQHQHGAPVDNHLGAALQLRNRLVVEIHVVVAQALHAFIHRADARLNAVFGRVAHVGNNTSRKTTAV